MMAEASRGELLNMNELIEYDWRAEVKKLRISANVWKERTLKVRQENVQGKVTYCLR